MLQYNCYQSLFLQSYGVVLSARDIVTQRAIAVKEIPIKDVGFVILL